MNTTKLAKVIRKIVREEVQKEVRSILTEQKGQPSKSKKSLTLTEALSQTESEEYRTVQSFNAADARAGFASMQNGFGTPNVLEGHSGKIVSTEKVDPSVTKALTRDYSELVKRFKK
mgnify:CR=1 FL=1